MDCLVFFRPLFFHKEDEKKLRGELCLGALLPALYAYHQGRRLIVEIMCA
jgi:hypothetical protein